jgi:hypothetical protein
MSNEITIHARLKAEKGNSKVDAFVEALKSNWTGNRFIHNRQEIGTTEEAIDLGDIATGGYFMAINRDSTNFVSIRSGTGATNLVRINAGEAALFRVSGDASAPFAIADTAACELEYWLLAA